jgi:hypothetical protein
MRVVKSDVDQFDSTTELQAWRNGYNAGEAERVALATQNSDLRSQVLHLTQLLHPGCG